ncbi:DDIT3 protein, partial [Crotophaga sulcirostris]|nr:DDIT3 protein [Crotophaga sulcirostris]
APLWGSEGAGSVVGGCGLDAALAAELLELESAAPAGPPGSAPPPGLGTAEEEEGAGGGQGMKKKKRGGGPVASRELAKRRERASEQRVLELTAQNEQLRQEIGRLSLEVQRTRAALIDRIVSLHQR